MGLGQGSDSQLWCERKSAGLEVGQAWLSLGFAAEQLGDLEHFISPPSSSIK